MKITNDKEALTHAFIYSLTLKDDEMIKSFSDLAHSLSNLMSYQDIKECRARALEIISF